MTKYLFLFLLVFPFLSSKGQKSGKNPSNTDTLLLKNLMEAHRAQFGSLLADTQHLEIQILYTQINRDKMNKPHFTSFSYHLRPENYFYPASTVKLPLTALALEKIERLKKKGMDRNTPMFIGAVGPRQSPEKRDSSAENLVPSIAQFIKKIYLVSDNDAFNRLYEFLGPDSINGQLHKKGFPSARIIHRLSVGDDSLSARMLNPIDFVQNKDTLYHIPLRMAGPPSASPYIHTKKGLGYMVYHGKDSNLVHQPFDFTQKNGISLIDEQNMLKSILFPEKNGKGFHLNASDRDFLLHYMSMYPRESRFPTYPQDHYPDNYGKYILYGSELPVSIPPGIRIFNKIGQAYGYLIENAYVVDFNNHIEFLISAVINTNTDQIYNDDQYAYTTIGYPFFRNLGTYLLEMERARKKDYLPDLKEFTLRYPE